MNPADIKRLLRDHGIAPSESHRIAQALAEESEKHNRSGRAHDWGHLLKPVNAQIKSISSSAHRWRQHSLRAPVYAAYMALLRKVRTKIKTAHRTYPYLSIADVAAHQDPPLPNSGFNWVNWVPVRVQDAFRLEFDRLYSDPSMPSTGKRIVPFSTAVERTASDKRWERLIAQISVELHVRTAVDPRNVEYSLALIAEQQPLIDALRQAQSVALARQITDLAPVDWRHLLTPMERKQLADWRDASLNGLRCTHPDGRVEILDRPPPPLRPLDDDPDMLNLLYEEGVRQQRAQVKANSSANGIRRRVSADLMAKFGSLADAEKRFGAREKEPFRNHMLERKEYRDKRYAAEGLTLYREHGSFKELENEMEE